MLYTIVKLMVYLYHTCTSCAQVVTNNCIIKIMVIIDPVFNSLDTAIILENYIL